MKTLSMDKGLGAYVPGMLMALLIAIPSWILGQKFPVIGAPIIAIVIGMVLSCTVPQTWRQAQKTGLGFASKKILQYAVILLGFGLNLKEIIRVGRTSLLIIFCTISVSLILSYVLYRLLRLDSKAATLIGVGSSICGGSAIAATAPVIEAEDTQIAQAMSVIFLFNVLAALIFPTLGEALGMSTQGFGIFAGTAVNDTSSVTAAASAWDAMHGSNALDIATIVKLTRTLAIIPITLVLAMLQARRQSQASSVSLRKIFPYFILYFLLAAVVTTLFDLPEVFTKMTKWLSKFFIVIAMGAIGMKTDVKGFAESGIKPIVQGMLCWIAIAVTSLVLQNIQGLW